MEALFGVLFLTAKRSREEGENFDSKKNLEERKIKREIKV